MLLAGFLLFGGSGSGSRLVDFATATFEAEEVTVEIEAQNTVEVELPVSAEVELDGPVEIE